MKNRILSFVALASCALASTILEAQTIPVPANTIMQAIDHLDYNGVVVLLDRDAPTKEQGRDYILAAQLTCNALEQNIIFWKRVRYAAYAGIPVATIFSLLLGIASIPKSIKLLGLAVPCGSVGLVGSVELKVASLNRDLDRIVVIMSLLKRTLA